MGGVLLKIRTWWETADKTTRTVTLVGVGLLGALLTLVFYFSSSPDLKLLYGGLEETERGRVVQKLQELKIPYKVETNGDVLAPGHQLAEIRAKLAMSGIPSSTSMGNSRLDSLGMGTAGPVMDRQMLLAMQEELERTISFMSPVAAAKVHIAPGNDSPFADTKVEPSASVVVQLKPGVGSDGAVAEAIVRMISTSVPGLNAQNVSVSSSDGVLLYDGKEDEGAGMGLANKRRTAEIQESSRLKREIETMITRTIGPGKAIVSVNVEMNFDRSDVKKVEDTPSKPVVVGKTSEAYGADAANLAAGGTGATGATTPPAAGGGKNYVMTSEESAVGSTHQTTETSVAPGKTTTCRVSIMLDESVAAQQKNIESYASNLIGADKDPENFKVSVSAVKFDSAAAEAAKKEVAAAKSSQMMQQIISLIPVIALVVVGFLVMKALGKAASNNSNVLVSAGKAGALASGSAAVMTTSSGITGTVVAPGTPLRPGQSETVGPNGERIIIEESGDRTIVAIPDKFDNNFESIQYMAEHKPEKVALLIKSWLLEETR
ncbi:MAG: flagellar basal-body MS-ring/collar protein FliF [Fimbriimonadales bacterium]